ncbi:MAG TPA: type I secretion protein, partial [Planctomycetaceae bacterium]|nr:type I secretion protein [Planctomycetaceae bacterium]
MEVVVDTVVPPGFFGQISLADSTQGLAAESDSGVDGDPGTFVDRVTNDTTPSFYGRAEANAIVRVYAETNGVAGLQSSGVGADLFLGMTVSTPLDGTNQFPGGQWSFTTPLDLNNPNLGFAKDGVRSLYMTSEDVAGNTTPDAVADRLNIFLDTAGPQVTSVEVTGFPAFNLFGLKPDNSVEGPTPRVGSMTIRVQDLPNRSNVDPNFLYAALQQSVVTTPGNIVLRGDHSGIIAIESIAFVGVPPANGVIATGSIILNFFEPLPDDRYALTIKENVVDPVGNMLDGESNASEPNGNPQFASGDGQPGGDFIARFTVDSRPEIAAASEGLIYVDINGNHTWDPTGEDNDATNRDLVFQLGRPTDRIFAGNFSLAGAASASGFDKLGAYGKVGGTYSFAIDTDDDGVADFVSIMPAQYQVNGIPVAGDFSNAKPGDEIGLFDGTYWYLDQNGNNLIDLGERIQANHNGLPIVGDFNGDGTDDLATFVPSTNTFQFDTNRNG